MLVILTTDDQEIEWHVGEPKPLVWGKDLHHSLSRISSLQADGHELEYIRDQYRRDDQHFGDDPWYSIPMPNARIVRWAGDIARTIYLNL